MLLLSSFKLLQKPLRFPNIAIQILCSKIWKKIHSYPLAYFHIFAHLHVLFLPLLVVEIVLEDLKYYLQSIICIASKMESYEVFVQALSFLLL